MESALDWARFSAGDRPAAYSRDEEQGQYVIALAQLWTLSALRLPEQGLEPFEL